jgi:hypothetical protein
MQKFLYICKKKIMKKFAVEDSNLLIEGDFNKVYSNPTNDEYAVQIEVINRSHKVYSRFFVHKICHAPDMEAVFRRQVDALIAEYPQFKDIDFMACAQKGGRFKN